MPSFAIRRRRLEDVLDEHPDRRVVLVRGPFGAGKTVLVAQWVRAQSQPCAWLSVDTTHNQVAQLLGDLMAVAASLQPDAGDVAVDRRVIGDGGDGLDVAAVADAFAAATRRLGTGVILVLDDVHRLHQWPVRHVLGRLVECPPEGVRLVLISRSKLRLGLERARLRGDLVEVAPAELRFRRGEIDDLVAGWTGRSLDAADIEQQTLGWAAGLRLVLLAASDREASTRPDELVGDYVAEELLEGWGPDVGAFLEVTCWLPVLTQPICDAVAGQGGSRCPRSRLDVEEALPIVAVASRPGSFRYPPILVRALQEEYRRRDPAAAARAQAGAAVAARQAGDVVTSLRLFLQAGSVDVAADVCRDLAAENESALRAVDELLQELPDLAPDGEQWLAWRARAAAAAGRIDESRQLLERAGPVDASTPATARAEGTDLLMARAVVAEHGGDVATLCACADRLLAAGAQPGPGSVSVGRAHGWRIRALVWSGDVESARAALRALEQSSDQPAPATALDLARAWVAWIDGDVSRLAELTATRRGPDSSEATAELALLSGAAQRERNQTAKAMAELEQASTAASRTSHHVVAALAASELARCQHVAGASMDALELVVSTQARCPDLPPAVDGHLRATQTRLRLDHGDLGGARAAVRDAPSGVDTSLLAARLALHATPAAARQLLGGVEARTPRQAVEKLLLWAQLPDGEPEAMSAALVEAIAAGGPLGLVRTFLDEGPAMNRRLVALASEVSDRDLGRVAALACQELAGGPVRPPAVPVDQLTTRELAVLRMLPLRISNQEMAVQMCVSINTLKTHIRAIYRKLDVSHRSEAIRRARGLQLV